MPRATVDVTPQHFDLKTCPEGFVKLRRLSYGEKLKRNEMVGNMEFEGSNRRDMKAMLNMVNSQVAYFEFAKCIVDHNLEDENGTKLDFTKRAHVDNLDGQIADEINEHIASMNNYEGDDEQGNS